jgi:hypothetical protein
MQFVIVLLGFPVLLVLPREIMSSLTNWFLLLSFAFKSLGFAIPSNQS